jgi:type IV pilus assembly protein PilA
MQDLIKRLRAKRANDEGFTLIELLVVVVIIGILIAIAIPLYLNYEKGAQNKSAASDLRGGIATLEQCYTDNNNAYPAALTGSAPAYTACTGSTINVSSGNALTYLVSGTTAYDLEATHTGNGTWYCYSSAAGGSVKTEPSTATLTAYGACP